MSSQHFQNHIKSIMTNKLKPVVFIDLDNTLLEGAFESIVFPMVFDELSQKSGLAVSEIRKMVVNENFSRQDNPNIRPDLAMDWDDIIQTVAAKLNVTIPQSLVLNIVKSHLHSPFIKLLENAFETLTILNTKQHYLVAATKGLAKYQMPLIEALGITSFFVEVLTPDKNNALKKHIEFYGDWVNLTATQIIVGDHLMDDIVYPKSFGFKSIWRLTDGSILEKRLNPFERPLQHNYPAGITIKPDAIIFNLKELPEVISILES
jgi:putative hydrolase of the HAD superfamily